MSTGLFAEEKGTGRPVLFLHGIAGTSRYWAPVADALKGEVRVVAVDLLGGGRSPKPKDCRYGYEEHLDAITATLAELKIDEPLVVVGHSMGALLALRLAVERPHLVRGLVLIGTPVYEDEVLVRQQILSRGDIPWWARHSTLSRPLLLLQEQYKTLWAAIAPLQFRAVPGPVAREAVRRSWDSYWRSLRNVIGRQGVHGDLARLQVPALLLYGTKDGIGRHTDLVTLSETNRLVQVRLIPGAGHQLPIEAPDLLAAEILRLAASPPQKNLA